MKKRIMAVAAVCFYFLACIAGAVAFIAVAAEPVVAEAGLLSLTKAWIIKLLAAVIAGNVSFIFAQFYKMFKTALTPTSKQIRHRNPPCVWDNTVLYGFVPHEWQK